MFRVRDITKVVINETWNKVSLGEILSEQPKHGGDGSQDQLLTQIPQQNYQSHLIITYSKFYITSREGR